jgi:uncharacterized membrane protein YdbT with pleckstrin-like domain
MPLKLNAGETIRVNANFHWSTYIGPAIIAGLFTLPLFNPRGLGGVAFGMAIVGWCPLVYRLLSNKCKTYVVTNQRIHIEEGILAKNRKDMPLQKINDIQVSQSLSQRVFGCGNIMIMTGNDKSTTLKGLDKPEEFREAVTATENQKMAA